MHDDSSGFVDRFYVMNPQFEDLLIDGEQLQNGMRVLIETYALKVDLTGRLSNEDTFKAKMNNRWCTVTQLKTTNDVCFIGVYHDGTKMKRTASVSYGWFVKLDSISDVSLVGDKKNHLETTPSVFVPDDYIMISGLNLNLETPMELQPDGDWVSKTEPRFREEKGTGTCTYFDSDPDPDNPCF